VTGLLLPVIRRRGPRTRSPRWLLTAGAAGCGLAAALFTGTPWVPIAYLGALIWGACGTAFYAVAATTLQRLAPAGKLAHIRSSQNAGSVQASAGAAYAQSIRKRNLTGSSSQVVAETLLEGDATR
jgi:hypothetical protein